MLRDLQTDDEAERLADELQRAALQVEPLHRDAGRDDARLLGVERDDLRDARVVGEGGAPPALAAADVEHLQRVAPRASVGARVIDEERRDERRAALRSGADLLVDVAREGHHQNKLLWSGAGCAIGGRA